MTSNKPERLSAEEVAALRRAAQNQLVRWSRHGVDADGREHHEHLRRALHKLKTVRGGCVMRPQLAHEPYRGVASGHGAES